MIPELQHSYAETFGDLALPAVPDISQDARVAWVNEDLAGELGLEPQWLTTDEGLAWLTGQSENQQTFALAYSGFQFGQLSPVLGDGRAHLVGERATLTGGLVDLHLKGSGLTPFSRPGSDGKAPLSAVWREVVIGESLHALGLPTSRALAVIETGETVRRRSPTPEPAGIVVRVAASHLRVGTFQYAQMRLEADQRQKLVNYALDRHFPHLADSENPALALLEAVMEQQIELVARWAGLGFVHGVLNSDNVTISGEAIDFGPCAFIDTFRRDAVFSSIDRQGRYAFSHQAPITLWNLARFAESLLDLIDQAEPNRAVHLATGALEQFEEKYKDARARVFAAKFGIELPERADGATLDALHDFVEKTFDLMEKHELDFTSFFRTLTDGVDNPEQVHSMLGEDEAEFSQKLQELRVDTAPQRSQELMSAANPIYIPRNLRLEEALRAVEMGEQSSVERLIDAVKHPYVRRMEYKDLETAPMNSAHFVSFCGT